MDLEWMRWHVSFGIFRFLNTLSGRLLMQFSNLDNNIIKSQAIVSKQNKFANFFYNHNNQLHCKTSKDGQGGVVR